MSHDHESPRDQNFVGSSDEHKPATASAVASASATAQASAVAMALHTIHSNSFVGFRGSDLGNRGERDISKHYDDVTDWNDVEICGKFGGEGIGGIAVEGEVMSGVVRGFVVVMGLVEG